MRRRVTSAILRTTALFSGAEGLSIVCGVIRTKLIAILTGTAGVGLLGILLSVCDMAGAFATSGLRTGGVRSIASAPAQRRSEIIGLIRQVSLWTGLGAGAVTLALSPLLSYMSLATVTCWPLFGAVAIAVTLSAVTASEAAVMQGSGCMKALAASALESNVIALVLSCGVIYFLRDDSGIVPVVLIYAAVTALTYSANSRRNIVFHPTRLSLSKTLKEGRSLWQMSGALTLSGVASLGAGYAVISLISFSSGIDESGLYQAGYLIVIKYVGIVFTSMAVEYFPRLSAPSVGRWRASIMMRHECMIFLPLVTVGGMILSLVALPLVRLLFDDSFMRVVPMILFAVPSLVARVVSWNMACVVLAKGSPRLYMATECVGAILMVVCVSGGYVLFGLAGAGIGITIEYLLYAAMEAIVLKRKFGIEAGRRMWIVVVVCFVVLICASAIALCHDFPRVDF